jgi:Na+-translocating ferredoxin:NAD+ oxidoreductase RnfG subunit
MPTADCWGKTLRHNETPALGGRIGDWPNHWLATFSGNRVTRLTTQAGR